MLTKSLHTVTAATNVARECLKVAADAGRRFESADKLAQAALAILGYDYSDVYGLLEARQYDPTVQRIVAACAKLLSESRTDATRELRRAAAAGILTSRQAG